VLRKYLSRAKAIAIIAIQTETILLKAQEILITKLTLL